MSIKLPSVRSSIIIGLFFFSFISPVLPQPLPKTLNLKQPANPQIQPDHNVKAKTKVSNQSIRDSLELDKLRAEIEKLNIEKDTGRYTLWFQLGTLASALLAAAISIWSAARAQGLQIESLNQQRVQRKQERISDLLQQLGSENPRSRMAAARAIGEYSELTVFLVDLLQSEPDIQVTETIIASLKAIGSSSVKALRDATVTIRKREILVIAELRAINEPLENIAKAIGLDNQEAKDILISEDVALVQFEASKKASALELICPSSDHHEKRSSLLNSLFALQESHATVRKAIEEVAAHLDAGFTGDLRNAHLRFIDLSGVNLQRWLFDGADLSMSNLCNSIFDGSSFTTARMTYAKLQNSSLRSCNFSSAELSNSNFKMARLHDAKLDRSICKAAKFSGAKLTRSSFRSAKLHAAKLISVFAKNVIFDDAELFRCNFASSVVDNGSFRHANLSGAVLNGMKGIKADFTAAILAGTQIKGSSLQAAIFDQSSFSSIHEVGGTDFSGASFSGAKFQHSDEFQSFVLLLPKQEQAAD
jgi:uncharacterized protein YjbI with pentapeptide repeats